MVKIEAETLEGAYSLAAEKLSCSITQLNIEVIQIPKSGLMGLFKKQAIIVATPNVVEKQSKAEPNSTEQKKRSSRTKEEIPAAKSEPKTKENEAIQKKKPKEKKEPKRVSFA